jgi:hypothetical protein
MEIGGEKPRGLERERERGEGVLDGWGGQGEGGKGAPDVGVNDNHLLVMRVIGGEDDRRPHY